jgi:hypothetical protein
VCCSSFSRGASERIPQQPPALRSKAHPIRKITSAAMRRPWQRMAHLPSLACVPCYWRSRAAHPAARAPREDSYPGHHRDHHLQKVAREAPDHAEVAANPPPISAGTAPACSTASSTTATAGASSSAGPYGGGRFRVVLELLEPVGGSSLSTARRARICGQSYLGLVVGGSGYGVCRVMRDRG